MNVWISLMVAPPVCIMEYAKMNSTDFPASVNKDSSQYMKIFVCAY